MTEAQEQKELIKWFRGRWPEHTKCIRLSMLGDLGRGAAAFRRQANLKAMGATQGEADLAFLIPSGGSYGLVIEYKAGEGTHKLSEAQAEYLEYMRGNGYTAICCKGLNEAKGAIEGYMKWV